MNNIRIFPKGDMFHLCNKSISNYHIFRKEKWIVRFLTAVNYYNNIKVEMSLSKALRKPLHLQNIMMRNPQQIIYVLAYCIMPDHYHLLVKVNSDYLLSKYISDLENSYTRYYNKINERKGPLWQSRFRAVHIEDADTLLHVHRYIHLNATTAGLTKKPEDYRWSSCHSYFFDTQTLLNCKEIPVTSIQTYRQFVENQIDYQKTIKGIRRKLLE